MERVDTEGRFFFFKQKTAYEVLRSLVGSEMCVRDRADAELAARAQQPGIDERAAVVDVDAGRNAPGGQLSLIHI